MGQLVFINLKRRGLRFGRGRRFHDFPKYQEKAKNSKKDRAGGQPVLVAGEDPC
jgi:hypothetical protein